MKEKLSYEPLPWNPAWSETEWEQSLNSRLEALGFDLLRAEPMSALRNLAVDETLLFRVAERRRRPLLWFWDWAEPAVVLGSYQSVRDEFDIAVAAENEFAFARRISGGGAMVVEPARTITWSLIVPEAVVEGMSFRQSFAYLDMWAVRALRSIGVPAIYRPINDIASPDGKIAGAAQCRRKKTVLHHVTMAYALDGELMWKLLRLEQKRESAKGIASAVKQVAPLSDFTELSREAVVGHLAESFSSMYAATESELREDELLEADERITAKFSTKDWLYRLR